MAEGIELKTFGAWLKYYRERTFNERGGRLSQTRFAQELTKILKLDDFITRDQIASWEHNTVKIHPSQRNRLVGMISLLWVYGAIKTLAQANQFLSAGNYQILSQEEISLVNPGWLQLISPEPESSPAPDPKEPDPNIPNPLSVIVQKVHSGPGSAPPLPSLFVGREEDMSNLKRNLLTQDPSGPTVQVLTAIKGWPGVGKTTVASALAYDEDMIKAFPDGVLWVSLGQEPNLLSEVAAWGRALGSDELLLVRSVEEARAQLAGLLRNKRMLLIIDDIWEPEHARGFTVGGPHCATLITTRRADIASGLAPTPGHVYRLNELNDANALKLLKELAPQVVADYPGQCQALVKELEGLPLALQVAGRLLNAEADYGFGVSQLIEDLRKGARLLEAQAPANRFDRGETTPTVAALLLKSVERLDENTRDCFAYLGVFIEKPATFGLDALQNQWQVDDPKPYVKKLIDHGLLEYVPASDRYQLHALLIMLAQSLLTDD